MKRSHSFGGSKISRQRIVDRHHERVEWLRARPQLWAGLPSDTEDVEPEASERIVALVEQLRDAALFGRGSLPDQKMSVRRAIRDLKREPVSA